MNNLRYLIGKRIRHFRKSKNLTQEQLAELIGIGTPNISYMENGKFVPSIETLTKLAEILGVEPYEIYMCTAEKSTSELKKELFEALDNNEKLLRLVYKFFIAVK